MMLNTSNTDSGAESSTHEMFPKNNGTTPHLNLPPKTLHQGIDSQLNKFDNCLIIL